MNGAAYLQDTQNGLTAILLAAACMADYDHDWEPARRDQPPLRKNLCEKKK